MSRILGAGVIAVGALAFAAPAFAQGFYVSGNVGVNWQKDHDFDAGGADVDTETDPGYVFMAAVGHDYGALTSNINLRAEAELSYRTAEVDSHEINGVSAAGAGGDLTSWALMFNGFLDFKTNSRVTPYVGLGVGVARVDVDDYSTNVTGNVLDDDDTVFAWQAAAGAAYELTNSFDVTAEYRYFNTTDPDIGGEDIEYLSHAVMIGGRYRF